MHTKTIFCIYFLSALSAFNNQHLISSEWIKDEGFLSEILRPMGVTVQFSTEVYPWDPKVPREIPGEDFSKGDNWLGLIGKHLLISIFSTFSAPYSA